MKLLGFESSMLYPKFQDSQSLGSEGEYFQRVFTIYGIGNYHGQQTDTI